MFRVLTHQCRQISSEFFSPCDKFYLIFPFPLQYRALCLIWRKIKKMKWWIPIIIIIYTFGVWACNSLLQTWWGYRFPHDFTLLERELLANLGEQRSRGRLLDFEHVHSHSKVSGNEVIYGTIVNWAAWKRQGRKVVVLWSLFASTTKYFVKFLYDS